MVVRRGILLLLACTLMAHCGSEPQEEVNESPTSITIGIYELIGTENCTPGEDVGEGRQALPSADKTGCHVVGDVVIGEDDLECQVKDARERLFVALSARGKRVFNEWVKAEAPDAGAVVVDDVVVSTPPVVSPSPGAIDFSGASEAAQTSIEDLLPECPSR